MAQGSILFVGDVHLGRRPARVPDLASEGIDARELSPRAAFEAVVREARARAVDAVVFLGDVVDREEHFLEAWGTLRQGVGELLADGIAVLAVAGNHDVVALPRLADEIAGFRLIGRGGVWETVELARAGAPFARLLGWSFPRARVDSSPLADLRPPARDGLCTLGLLHGELDASGGPYAPFARRELDAAGLDAWLLGHVHAPSREGLAQARPVGYLGSLVGLDPTETDVHGPWLARFGAGRAPALEQLALAPLVWLALELDVATLDDTADLPAALARALSERAGLERERLGAARAVGCRLRLVGAHARKAELALRVRELRERLDGVRPNFDGRAWFLERIEDASVPALDLAALARGDDPPGLLARRLLALESESEVGAAWVVDARRAMEDLVLARPFAALGAGAPDERAVRERLLRAGRAALAQLLAGREVAP